MSCQHTNQHKSTASIPTVELWLVGNTTKGAEKVWDERRRREKMDGMKRGERKKGERGGRGWME
jgi:hypothetical protein